jgi:hypothetical protein
MIKRDVQKEWYWIEGEYNLADLRTRDSAKLGDLKAKHVLPRSAGMHEPTVKKEPCKKTCSSQPKEKR